MNIAITNFIRVHQTNFTYVIWFFIFILVVIRKGAVCASTLTVAYARPLNANSLASTLLLAISCAVAKTEFNMWSGARDFVVAVGCRISSSCPINPEVSRVCWLPSQSCTCK